MKWFLLVLFFVAQLLVAEESIVKFHSDITVNPDSSMDVIETITVKAEGQQIKRGVYRDFPTRYEGNYGTYYNTTFDVKAIKRDGQAESYRIKKMNNGYRVYIGDKDVLLPPGEYRYHIHYQTKFQLGYFDEHDELYWNVTGNGWDLAIGQVSAVVHLPDDASENVIDLQAYTGLQGERGDSYRVIQNNGEIQFTTDRPLAKREGLTIVVSWPKGIVTQPTAMDKFWRFVQDNLHYVVLVFGLLLITLYYFAAWLKVGKDPVRGVIYPRYVPPRDLQADDLGYMKKMDYENRLLAALLVHVAAKGYLTIHKNRKKFRISKRDSSVELNDKEQQVIDHLLGSRNELELDNDNHSIFSAAIDRQKKILKARYQPDFFKSNWLYALIGLLLSIGLIMLIIMLSPQNGVTVIILLALLFLVSIVVFVQALKLMRRPTKKGCELLDEIDGFIEFIKITEEDAVKDKAAPKMTTELFEQYLPYAIAFNLEQQWGDRLTRSLYAAGKSQHDYRPRWYDSDSPFTSKAIIGAGFGAALASSIASASIAPGESSGGSSSGSSGGGGGGGGGGGW